MELPDLSLLTKKKYDSVLYFFLKTVRDANAFQFSDEEFVFLNSIFANVIKLSGNYRLDTYVALYSLRDSLQRRHRGKINKYENLLVLKNIDTRIIRNQNSYHREWISNLPFKANFLLSPKFLWAYFFSLLFVSKLFFKTVLDMIFTLIYQINNVKTSLVQILYTDLYPNEQTQLFISLSENPLLSKALQLFFLDYENVSYVGLLQKILYVIFSTQTQRMQDDITWTLLDVNLNLREHVTEKINSNFGFLQSVFIPSIITQFIPSVVGGGDAYRSTLQAARLGVTPRHDINIITTTIEQLTDELAYISTFLSNAALLFAFLLFTYCCIYGWCWWYSVRQKKFITQFYH